MADDKPLIQVDSDWKKQAQQEKQRLAEQQSKAAAAPAPAAPAAGVIGAPTAPSRRRDGASERRTPVASFEAIVQTLMTQALYYLGELSPDGYDQPANLDMARYQIDLITVLEGKTAGQLTPAEQKTLDAALYETRSRFTSVAQQYI